MLVAALSSTAGFMDDMLALIWNGFTADINC